MRVIEGNRGYWGIAVYRPKREVNIGTLWRTCHLLGAQFFATIGARYDRQPSDTLHSMRHVPLFEYQDFPEFLENLPRSCRLIAVEMGTKAIEIERFNHPERCIYLLGAEDNGLPEKILEKCWTQIKLRGERSMNMAVAGSIVAYHRGL